MSRRRRGPPGPNPFVVDNGSSSRKAELERLCRNVGLEISALCPPGVGFCLLFFDFGLAGDLAFIANAKREDMIATLHEFISILEKQS